MQKKLPTEILQEIIQYSDTLTRVTLGFPIDKGKLLDEGGPGKVLDEFLRRNGDLEYLKKWIPGECALMHGVLTKDPKKLLEIDRIWNANMFSNQGYELSIITKFVWGVDYIKHDRKHINMEEYYIFTRQWDKIEKPIDIYKCHPKYLVDIPEEYLDEEGRLMLSLYRGEEINTRTYGLYITCLQHELWKQAIDTVPKENESRLIDDLYELRSVDGLRCLGIFSEKELRAYEVSMSPEDDELLYSLSPEEKRICDNIGFKYFGEVEWYRDMIYYTENCEDIGCTDTTWENMLGRALHWNLPGKRDDKKHMAYKDRNIVVYPYPPNLILWNIKAVSRIDMALFFWAKYEVVPPSVR
ncbi:hypothetical protein BJ944DRAFT_266609 [Cunninghamella echinulata]|nr:hypothetical protein BJ944DRAFT_266609 [Cunninghamella echinulata]